MSSKSRKLTRKQVKSKKQVKSRKSTRKKSKSKSKTKSIKSTLTKSDIIKMEYPYRNLEITKYEMLDDFNKLKNYKTKIFRYNPNPRKYRITPFKNNKYLIFSESYHKNKELYRITDYFSHKCRVRCVMNMAEKESILALFTKNKIAMLEEFERKNTPLTIHQMNEYLFRKFKDCTSFNTTMVMNILNLFKPRRWLDCSAGWGDRLVGAIAFDCEYLGVDPSKCMTPVYQEIIKGLVKSAEKRKQYEVVCDGFENVKVKTSYYDLVFTSPPFFDFEVYEDNSNQSIEKFNTVNKWKNHFLFPLIEKSYKALTIGGYLALYITDFKGASYIGDMKNYVKANLKEQLRYEGDIHWLNKEPPKKIRTIYVWKKIM